MNYVIVNNTAITPAKIICIGRNYVEHITELGNELPDEMVIFLKPNSAISDQLNYFSQEQLHYEGELCFIYQQGKFSAVGFGLDITKQNLQNKLKNKGLPWERARSFNGSALFSNFVSIDKIDNSLTIELSINDVIIQTGSIDLMMYKPEDILKEIETFMTLEDGDIVMTGTPKGVGIIPDNAHFKGRVLQDGHELVSESWYAVPSIPRPV